MTVCRGVKRFQPGWRLDLFVSWLEDSLSRIGECVFRGQMPRFTNISASGRVRYGQLPGSIGILESLDKPMPIGIASAIGRTEGGLAV
jgi:hypothetical protein